jgi:hypothetical protein
MVGSELGIDNGSGDGIEDDSTLGSELGFKDGSTLGSEVRLASKMA